MYAAMANVTDMLEQLQDEVAVAREENTQLGNEPNGRQKALEERLEQRNQALMQTMKMMLERAQEDVKAQEKRSWAVWASQVKLLLWASEQTRPIVGRLSQTKRHAMLTLHLSNLVDITHCRI